MSLLDNVATRRPDLSAAKRELLERRLRGEAVGNISSEITPQIQQDGETPLSFAQQRLWFLDQLAPGNPFYNVDIALPLSFALDVAALERSFTEIVRRHEVLRTTFVAVDGAPRQVIAPARAVPLPVVDLSKLPSAEREDEATRLATEEARRSFDLATGPLLRTQLLRLGPADHLLLLTTHHIVFDGWSIHVLFQELGALYGAFVIGQPSPLPDLPIQYADFAAWQREWLQGTVLKEQLRYWSEQLADLPMLQLPTDHPRPAVQSFRGAKYPLALDADLTNELKALSQREGVTLFMTLLAGFKALLARYTRQATIVVGAPIAGRTRPELEGLIGFFVNSLVLRTELDGNPTVREVLQRVRETALGAYAHQDLPFEKLVEELQPERDTSRNPLFQVTFQYQPAARMPEATSAGIGQQPDVDRGVALFDMAWRVVETSDGLRGHIEYDTDLFENATIARMVGHYQQLLTGMVANPDCYLADLPLLTESERHQLLVAWNQTDRPYPTERTLAHLFEAQVARTPEATAVVFGDEALSYAELNRRANQLARHLQALGVGPDVLVGLCVERSLDLVVGIIGVLKAGGAYVPLDPAYPAERLAFMVADAQPPVLLTQRRLVEQLPTTDAKVLLLDALATFADQAEDNTSSRVEPHHLAYVIYTSGSTGQPKGVMITQQAITNHMMWMQETFQFGPDDAVLQKTPISFDASVWEFFAPFMGGGRLVVARPGGHLDAGYLIEEIQREQVTTIQVVPTLLTLLLDEQELAQCRSLKNVFCGGEPLTKDLKDRFFEILDADLHNLYGPTEACIDATIWSCTKSEQNQKLVSIGQPIANLQAYVLDDQLQPVPIGVPGELCIGGVGVARGYLDRPNLTAERFVTNPFAADPQARLYRTGDLACYHPDGAIEFLGRRDHQLKLRGYRIELGEIETTLHRHPGVRDAVVIVREDVAGDKRLVAYVVPDLDKQVEIEEWRRYLQEQLPHYMVPALYVPIEKLPLTPNGKVDRLALPAPDSSRPQLAERFVAPRTPVETMLAEIWADVLGQDEVGIHDDFFVDLGGHSLLATQIVARVQQTMEVDLPLRRFFETPTVTELAESIELIRWSTQSVKVATGSPEGELEEGEL